MSKVTVIESRDHEADYWVKQIKNGADEQDHRSFSRPGKVYELGTLRIDQSKKEVTISGNPVELEPKEFEILGLFVSHPNEALLPLYPICRTEKHSV